MYSTSYNIEIEIQQKHSIVNVKGLQTKLRHLFTVLSGALRIKVKTFIICTGYRYPVRTYIAGTIWTSIKTLRYYKAGTSLGLGQKKDSHLQSRHLAVAGLVPAGIIIAISFLATKL
jgi:membrane protein DedA with SNARE-associated domain